MEMECNEKVVKILVGNKIDLKQERLFDNYKGHKLAKKYGLDRYIEVSAQKGI